MKQIRKNKKLMIAIIAVSALSLAFAAVALAAPAITKSSKTDEPVNTDVTVTETTAKLLADEAVDPDAVFQSIGLEDENGTIVYEAIYTLDTNQIKVKVDSTSGVILSVEEDNDSEELGEADDDNIEFEDENDNDSLEEYESEDDDYDVDGIDWEEEGENDTEN